MLFACSMGMTQTKSSTNGKGTIYGSEKLEHCDMGLKMRYPSISPKIHQGETVPLKKIASIKKAPKIHSIVGR